MIATGTHVFDSSYSCGAHDDSNICFSTRQQRYQPYFIHTFSYTVAKGACHVGLSSVDRILSVEIQ